MSPAPNSRDRVGLPRRLGAILYDGLLLLAVLMVAEFMIVAPFGITEDHPMFLPLRLYVPLLAFGFFGWFWTHRRGQTLGMQAWHVQLISVSTDHVTWVQAGTRFLLALVQWSVVLAAIGLYLRGWWAAALPVAAVVVTGLVMAARDPERLMLHDRLSGTRLVKLNKA